jgi:BirA family biotin operon repressor/biotin-[acetyl-CoA-carboxylase] ligase
MVVCWHDQLDSTMAEAHRRSEQGAAHGTAIAAVRQSAGRGRHGRKWHSPTGGLWLSVILRPPTPTALDALPLRVGLAVAELIAASAPSLAPLALKWPNDLMLAERKAGGILVEARWNGAVCIGVVVGLGLNLDNPIPGDLAESAVALGALVSPAEAGMLAPRVLADPMARAITGAGRGGALTPDELRRWAAHDWLAGRTISEPIAGRVEGITADGALRVRDHQGEPRLVRAGVVTPHP